MIALVFLLSGKSNFELSRGILLLLSWNFSCLERAWDRKPSYIKKMSTARVCEGKWSSFSIHASSSSCSVLIPVHISKPFGQQYQMLSHHGMRRWPTGNEKQKGKFIVCQNIFSVEALTVVTKGQMKSKPCVCISRVSFLIFEAAFLVESSRNQRVIRKVQQLFKKPNQNLSAFWIWKKNTKPLKSPEVS